MNRKIWRDEAPSIGAPPQPSGGTALSLATTSTIAEAIPRHVLAITTIARGNCCNHCTDGIPKKPISRFRVECSPPADIEIQINPATTSGTALGNKMIELNRFLKRSGRRSRTAETSPRTNGPMTPEPTTHQTVTSNELQNSPSEKSSR